MRDPFDEVMRIAGDARERIGAPGVALGVLHDAREQVATMGVTSLEHPLEVTAETLFQIGSITKTMTGTAALRLVEQGVLELDAPVRTYVPELRLADPDVARTVTLRHLLTHSGGWVGDYFDDLGRGEDALTRMVEAMADLPQLTPLGGAWSYNNAGFYLAGHVLERATGEPYESIIRHQLFEPLGMEMSFFFPGDVMTHRFAVGHEPGEDGPQVARPWEVGRAAHPAGGVVTTIGDLLRYARFHLGDGTGPEGTRLMTRKLLDEMHAPQVPIGTDAMALTWFVREVGGKTLLHHGGSTNGQHALLWLVPGRDFAIAGCVNHAYGSALLNEALRAALRIFCGLDDRDPEPVELEPGAEAEYLGRYTAAATDVELSRADGALSLRLTRKGGFPRRDSPPPAVQPPPARVAFIGPDRLIALDGPLKGSPGEFIRDEAGEIVWLRLGARIHRRRPS